MEDLRTVGPWAVMPLNDRLKRYVVIDNPPGHLGTGKRQVATHVRSLQEAALLAAAPALRDALVKLFQSVKELADSGVTGEWRVEDTQEGRHALDALFLIGWEQTS